MMQILPWNGQKISAPGIYDMPIDVYHSDCCVGPSVSKSGLWTLIHDSPLHFFAEWYGNKDRVPRETTKAMTLGSAAHHLLLGQRDFDRHFVIRPEMIDGKPWQGNRTACREWTEAQTKPIITTDMLEIISGIALQLSSIPEIQNGLFNGAIEKSIIWQDEETGIWVKARPDGLPLNLDLIVDLKITHDASFWGCRNAISNFGYHMQMALGGAGIEHITGRKLGTDDYHLFFIEDKRPHAYNLKPLSSDYIGKGAELARKALIAMAECLNKDEWPSYLDHGKTVEWIK